MAKTYFYKAKDQTGQLLTGSLLADSEKAVALHIQGKGYYVLQIKEQRNEKYLVSVLMEKWHTPKIKDVAIVCRQLSTMLDAGLSLVICLGIIIEQTDNPHIRAALQNIYKKVKEGEAFSQALAEHDHVFPIIMVNMVEAGEIGGVLSQVLERLAIHFEKEYKLHEKIKTAMTYPAVVMIMAVISVAFIVIFVLPTFITLFVSMKVELPWPTRVLLFFSEFFIDYWVVLLLIVGGTSIVGKTVCVQPTVRKIQEKVVWGIPIIGQLVRKIAIARFSRILSTLISGGVPLITALDVVKKVIGNLSMMQSITNSQECLKEGVSLAATLASSHVFTPMVIQMVAIGEESGAVGKMLEKVADFYENEVDDMVARLGGVIEPVIVGILGILIGFIVIAVVLPLFDIMTNVDNVM